MPAASKPIAPVRRSQAERRETTRAALMTAALEQLLFDGLAGFTTTEVCKRAGLSQGALFKHFDTKADLLAAVTEHLFDELRAEFESTFIDLPAARRNPRSGIELLWDQMLDARLAAAYELYTAARTDTDLRAALEPVVAAHVERIHELAAALIPGVDDDRRRSAVDLALLAMQGLVVQQMALPDPAQHERLRELLDGLTVVLLTNENEGTN